MLLDDMNNTNPIQNLGWAQILRKGGQFLLRVSVVKTFGGLSWMRKGWDCVNDKRNIFVDIYDTDIP